MKNTVKSFVTSKLGVLMMFGALFFLAPAMANAQACTVTAGGASYVIPAASHYDITPTSNFTGVGTGDLLFEDGWWFRIVGDTQETVFPAPTTTTCAGSTGTITWADVSTRGFSATNTLSLTSAGANQGVLTLTMSITNLSSTVPLAISLFHGADFDVNGSAGTDTVTLREANTHLRIVDTTAGSAEYRAYGPVANAFMVRPFAATTDVFGLLGDTAITNLDNTGLPAASIDMTGAFQWDLVIPASGTRSVSVALTGNVPLVTASGVVVGGRVMTSEGRGIRGARVTVTDQNGVTRSVFSGVNGRFQFDDVEPGQTYVVNIQSRRFGFSPQVISITDNIADLE
ncbi:MAG: carboxypeptidase-like regulatory domain-containing protein, partial [Pyrinomonadaceae bacterium]